MVSLGVLHEKANLGVVITASHNPPSYNGYKLKGDFGGPLLPDQISEVEELIPDSNSTDYDKIMLSDLVTDQKISYVDLEQLYFFEENFDLNAIRNSDMNFCI